MLRRGYYLLESDIGLLHYYVTISKKASTDRIGIIRMAVFIYRASPYIELTLQMIIKQVNCTLLVCYWLFY